MFSRVLLALADGAGGKTGGAAARAAAQTACGLAARHGAAFAALALGGPLGQEGGGAPQLPGEDAQAERRTGIEALLREVMPRGLDVMHAAGFAHVEVLKAARVLGPDLLVLCGLDEAQGRRGEQSDASAGAAALIAAGASCAVLAVPDGADAQGAQPSGGPFERMLVAVDLADDPGYCRALLDFAARVAAREGAGLCVSHALPLAAGPAGNRAHHDMARRVAAARERLAYLCHGLPGADRFTLLAGEGEAGVDILKHVRERVADLLILGVHGEGRGRVLARVLAGARCPVLLAGPTVLRGQGRTAAATSTARGTVHAAACRDHWSRGPGAQGRGPL